MRTSHREVPGFSPPPAIGAGGPVETPPEPETDEYQVVAIDRLQESTSNPRRIYDPTKLQELADSFNGRTAGIHQPLVCRPVNNGVGPVFGHLEIILGSRRFRAAKLAGLTTVPVRLRSMSDEEVLDAQLKENSQREDVHPLEEANGFKQMRDQFHKTVEQIADKVGKSPSHVYQRLKLAELIEPAQAKFYAGEMTAAHAVQIARLLAAQQTAALAYMKQSTGYGREMATSRELAEWIRREYFLDLHSAPFKKSDPDLLPEAGACTDCPKRTGTQPQLFAEVEKQDTCTDPKCFDQKVAAHLEKRLAETAAAGAPLVQIDDGHRQYLGNGKHAKPPADALPPGKYTQLARAPKKLQAWQKTDPAYKSCEHAQTGIIVTPGENTGKEVKICRDPKCKVHGRPSSSLAGRNPDVDRYRQREKARGEKHKKQAAENAAVLDHILKHSGTAAGGFSRVETETIACALWRDTWHEHHKLVATRHPEMKLKTGHDPIGKQLEMLENVALRRFILELALIRDISNDGYYSNREKLLDRAAKELKIDRRQVVKQAAEQERLGQEAAAQLRAKDRKKPQTGGKTAKSPAGVCQECGCTETTPCTGGCAWVPGTNKTLCTECEHPNVFRPPVKRGSSNGKTARPFFDNRNKPKAKASPLATAGDPADTGKTREEARP